MRKSAFISSALFLLNLHSSSRRYAAGCQSSRVNNSRSQDPVCDVHYYRLEFVLKELGDDGRVVNSRTYHTSVSTDGKNSSLRIGTKIPVRTTERERSTTPMSVSILTPPYYARPRKDWPCRSVGMFAALPTRRVPAKLQLPSSARISGV